MEIMSNDPSPKHIINIKFYGHHVQHSLIFSYIFSAHEKGFLLRFAFILLLRLISSENV